MSFPNMILINIELRTNLIINFRLSQSLASLQFLFMQAYFCFSVSVALTCVSLSPRMRQSTEYFTKLRDDSICKVIFLYMFYLLQVNDSREHSVSYSYQANSGSIVINCARLPFVFVLCLKFCHVTVPRAPSLKFTVSVGDVDRPHYSTYFVGHA